MSASTLRLRIAGFLALFLLGSLSVGAQSNNGELWLSVSDPSGLGVKCVVRIVSEANQYRKEFASDDSGNLIVQRLPFGVYLIDIRQPGFAEVSQSVEIRSTIPEQRSIGLNLSGVKSSVTVKETNTLIDPDRAGAVNQIGSQQIQDRLTSLPGRSLQDVVNSQPGWLYEGNAVLHPRGSEYQTQFVVDGVPLTDNRSPSFGPEIEAADVDSLTIYTAGFPAEYGRKMGGVVEVNTLTNAQPGFHGQAVLDGGSFDTAGAFLRMQDTWDKNTLGFSASGDGTDRYLNPVVPQNYTNAGTTGDFSVSYERDFSPSDRVTASVRHEFSRYEIPNEQLQQAAGQLQNGDNFETMGIVSYQHTFSPNVVADFRGMVRGNANGLTSNPMSTPIVAFQQNHFREGYFKGSLVLHRGRHEWKFGVESDNFSLHENFSDAITDPSQFDPDTPATFAFSGSHADLEQSAFAQDLIHLGKWVVSAGLRWDHYQLLVNQNALSPRLSLSRYLPSLGLVFHASYDRLFQTPSSENILLSSSPAVLSLDPQVLRLPVEPSHGDYYETGFSKAFFGKFRMDANGFVRQVNNYADDDQLLNTAVSFPIAFERAFLYGAEGKIDIPEWRRLSGYASYSYIVGMAWFPVTGGLFLGDDAANAIAQLGGHFPDSQDQRNTARVRLRYQLTKRLWFAGGSEYGSGLPFEFDGDESDALAQYSQQVVNRVNFATGRVKPSLSVDVSVGANIYTSDRLNAHVQVDGANLNNRLNVIDFGGLFSGNAIGPPRSYSLRLTTNF